MRSIAVAPRYKDWDSIELAVGTAAVSLPTPILATAPEVLVVQAPAANTAKVYVGPTGVTGNGSGGGYEVAPGAIVTIPWGGKLSGLKAIAGGSSQNLIVNYYAGVV